MKNIKQSGRSAFLKYQMKQQLSKMSKWATKLQLKFDPLSSFSISLDKTYSLWPVGFKSSVSEETTSSWTSVLGSVAEILWLTLTSYSFSVYIRLIPIWLFYNQHSSKSSLFFKYYINFKIWKISSNQGKVLLTNIKLSSKWARCQSGPQNYRWCLILWLQFLSRLKRFHFDL